jgi:hypothetical protein
VTLRSVASMPHNARMSRSTRLWLVVAGLIAMSGVVASFLAFHLYPKGSLGQRFESGESVTASLSEGVPQMIWVRQGDRGFATVTCEVDAPGEVMTERVLPEYGIDELTDNDGVRWRGQAVVEVRITGTYKVTCPTDNREGAALSIGDPPRFRGIPERYVAPALPVVPGVLGGAVALVIGALTLRRARRGPARPSAIQFVS